MNYMLYYSVLFTVSYAVNYDILSPVNRYQIGQV